MKCCNQVLLFLIVAWTFGCGKSQTQKADLPAEKSPEIVATPVTGQQSAAVEVDRTVPPSINRKPDFDADSFQFLDQGSGFFPYDVVKALIDSETNRPYLENLERFGLLPGNKSENNPNGYPVGIVLNTVGVKPIKMFGFTCAACHTSDIRFGDKTVRIEGGSGLFFVDALGDAIANSMQKTLKDKKELVAFLKRLLQEVVERDGKTLHGLEDFHRIIDDGPFGKALVEHIEERFASILTDVKPPAIDKSLLASIAAKLHQLTHRADSSLKKLAEDHRLNAITDILSRLEECRELIEYRLRFLKMRGWLAEPGHRLSAGYGRADDFGTARVELFGELDATKGTAEHRNMEPVNAPVSVPPLWNIEQFAWLHWNSNTNSVIQRSIGESIGVGATFTHDNVTSVNIVNQMKIEQQIPHIATPEWPEDVLGKIDPVKQERGWAIYKDKCAGCHNPSERDEKGLLKFEHFTLEEAGTDRSDALNFAKPVFLPDGSQTGFATAIGGLLEKLQTTAKSTMSLENQRLMEVLENPRRPVKWRDPMHDNGGKVYPAKPLDGIWATAPYLHNGSVPTLYHLLLPAKDRPTEFVVGPQDYLPKEVGFEWNPKDFPTMTDKHNSQKKLTKVDTTIPGNHNTGHEFGADLSDDDRWDLIEYLKVHKTPSLSRDAVSAKTVDEKSSRPWAEIQAATEKTHLDYLSANAEGYDWFANATDGFAGVPVILLRSFPDLAPEIWGTPDEKFSRFGLIPSPTEPDRPLPLGLSWDPMVEGQAAGPLKGVALTCGACHIGRVRIPEGDAVTYRALVGAPNTQFDVRRWRHAFERTVGEYLNSPENLAKTAGRLREIIASKPANYFYGQYRGLDAGVEAKERELFAVTEPNDVAASILTGFATKIIVSKLAVDKQKATSYSKENAPPLDGGSPGQSDGSGDLIPRLCLLDTLASIGPNETLQKFAEMTFPALPIKKATVTDIVSTFNQGARNIAQIDGSVKSPFYRNVAASLAVAGDPKQVNVVNADITAGFIHALPAPAYPFDVDMTRVERGRKLFKTNCGMCHKDHNDIVYKGENTTFAEQIGTDPNRSQVLNADALQLFLKHFVASVPETYETKDANGKTYRPHDLHPNDIVFDRSELANQGYVTNALEGAWSRAPYLHHGSVPTLYHLLVPGERPATFARGSITYDQKHVGWQWNIEQIDRLKQVDQTVSVFNTAWDSSSNRGHDKNLTVDDNGNILRMDWSGAEKPGEHKVRLDWSGPEKSEALFDLIEYLKTL